MNAAVIAQVVALSDERDQWTQRLLDAEQAAYLRGYEDGRADQAARSDRVWAAMPELRVCVVPSHAELDALRYGGAR